MNPGDRTNTYHIRLQGHIDQRWLRWFEGLEISFEPNGETLISGQMDQSALYGVLDRIRDLGVDLIFVQRYSDDKQKES